MNNTILLITLLISGLGFSQVIIGDAIGTATDKTSVLLEFANTGNRGIILPYVRTLPTGPEGVLILDTTDGKVKYYNGSWVDLSGQAAETSVMTSVLSQQPTGITETGKAIIGSNTSSADGVLVLESTTKAMVLPRVTDTDSIPDPSPGMIVYLNKPNAKRLAVFNGTTWSYWKP